MNEQQKLSNESKDIELSCKGIIINNDFEEALREIEADEI